MSRSNPLDLRSSDLHIEVVYVLLNSHDFIDSTDKRIITILQENCNLSLENIASDLKIPKATLHYRIKRLEKRRIIVGYHAAVDPAKLGKKFLTLTFVHSKYGPGLHRKIGEKLAAIPGVVAVYFIYGDIDFVVVTKSESNEDFLRKAEEIMNIDGVLSASTNVVALAIKEDNRLEFEDLGLERPSRNQNAGTS